QPLPGPAQSDERLLQLRAALRLRGRGLPERRRVVPPVPRPDHVGRPQSRLMPARAGAKRPRAAAKAARPPDPALRGRAAAILARLAKAYPDWGPTLAVPSPLALLVASIPAAHAQDGRMHQATQGPFHP